MTIECQLALCERAVEAPGARAYPHDDGHQRCGDLRRWRTSGPFGAKRHADRLASLPPLARISHQGSIELKFLSPADSSIFRTV